MPCNQSHLKLNVFCQVIFVEIEYFEGGSLMYRVILYLGKYSVQMNFRLQRVKEWCCVTDSFLCTVLECAHGMLESVCLITL